MHGAVHSVVALALRGNLGVIRRRSKHWRRRRGGGQGGREERWVASCRCRRPGPLAQSWGPRTQQAAVATERPAEEGLLTAALITPRISSSPPRLVLQRLFPKSVAPPHLSFALDTHKPSPIFLISKPFPNNFGPEHHHHVLIISPYSIATTHSRRVTAKHVLVHRHGSLLPANSDMYPATISS